MKQIDNQKIKTYDECNADEKEVLDMTNVTLMKKKSWTASGK